MPLRLKTLLIILGIAGILITAVYGISHFILLQSYNLLEQQQSEDQVKRANNAINHSIDQVIQNTQDWAPWDDTYQFIQGQNETYVEDNLTEVTFDNLGLNVFLFYTISGRLYYGQGFDLTTSSFQPVSKSLLSLLAPGHPLIALNFPGDSASGIVLLPEGPILLASAAITTNEGSGPVPGIIVMGRYLDRDLIQSLGALYQLNITTYPYNGKDIPAEAKQALLNLKNGTFYTKPYNNNTISGFTLLNDITGNPAVLLRVDNERTIWKQGYQTINYFAISVILVCLVVGWVASLVIGKLVINPVHLLSQQINRIGTSGDLNSPIQLSGKGEITQLAGQINEMLGKLMQKDQDLRYNEQMLRSVINQSRDGIILTDEQGSIIEWSVGEEKISGIPRAKALGRPTWEMLHEMATPARKDQISSMFPAIQGFFKGGKAPFMDTVLDYEIQTADGQSRFVQSVTFTIPTEKGFMAGSINRDITESKLAQQALKESEERYALAIRGSNDGIWDWDLLHGAVYYSPRWKLILGYTEDEISSRPDEWLNRVHVEDLDMLKNRIDSHIKHLTPHLEFEHRLMHRDGHYHWVLVRGLAVWDSTQNAYRMAGSMTDITNRKASEEQLRHDAMHDVLTGLPNRAYFMDQLKRSVERNRRHGNSQSAVLFIDLDRFKFVNDSLGHIVGDQMLIEVSQRLLKCLRPEDTIARFGGDQFTILVSDVQNVQDLVRISERIQKFFHEPFHLAGNDVINTVSIGIAISSSQANPDDLLRDASTAANRAKLKGAAQYEIFDEEMHHRSLSQLKLEIDLRRGIEREEFMLYYQPIISLDDGKVKSAEALVRWRHPERGLVSPMEFIPLAESTGLILPLGEWILRSACAQLKKWQVDGNPGMKVAVNISAMQFQQQNLPDLVWGFLLQYQLKPSDLILEITESTAMGDTELSNQKLNQLHAMGVQIAIDDFGTSYSSMGYLKRFPVSTLKIDRSFIQGIRDDNDSRVITTAMIAMGHLLNLKVVAEGVENRELLDFLMIQGCDFGQGFYFSQPVPPDEFAVFLTDQSQIEAVPVSG